MCLRYQSAHQMLVSVQGYGAVTPVMGLNALCMALTRQLPQANVVVNPFAWEQFLSGERRHVAPRKSNNPCWEESRCQGVTPWHRMSYFAAIPNDLQFRHQILTCESLAAGKRRFQPFFGAVQPAANAEHADAKPLAAGLPKQRPTLSLDDLISTIAGACTVSKAPVHALIDAMHLPQRMCRWPSTAPRDTNTGS